MFLIWNLFLFSNLHQEQYFLSFYILKKAYRALDVTLVKRKIPLSISQNRTAERAPNKNTCGNL